MLSTEECKKHLADLPLTDAQVGRLRDALYALVENVLDDYIKKADTVEPCKKLSSTAESPLSGRKQKATV